MQRKFKKIRKERDLEKVYGSTGTQDFKTNQTGSEIENGKREIQDGTKIKSKDFKTLQIRQKEPFLEKMVKAEGRVGQDGFQNPYPRFCSGRENIFKTSHNGLCGPDDT